MMSLLAERQSQGLLYTRFKNSARSPLPSGGGYNATVPMTSLLQIIIKFFLPLLSEKAFGVAHGEGAYISNEAPRRGAVGALKPMSASV
jgi:hypothetical protein